MATKLKKSPSGYKFVIITQGGPVLNEGRIMAACENIVALEIDMRSKRCEVIAESATDDGAPVIWLDGTNALHLKKGCEKEQTEVAFPAYKGWEIFSAHVCRYTLRVCLMRRNLTARSVAAQKCWCDKCKLNVPFSVNGIGMWICNLCRMDITPASNMGNEPEQP